MLTDLTTQAKSLVSSNATSILTAGGVVGTVSTGILAARAGYKAGQVITIKNTTGYAEKTDYEPPTTKEKIILVGPQFVPSIVTGGLTCASIIFAHKMNASKATAMAALYGASQKQRDEYKAKLEEKLGLKKAELAGAEIQQARIDGHPVDKGVIIIGNGEVLCYDAYSDRYFKASVDEIKKAEQAVFQEILTGNECSLGFFYEKLGLPQIGVSNDVGWNINVACEVQILTTLAKGSEPCLVIQFADLPVFDYGTSY